MPVLEYSPSYIHELWALYVVGTIVLLGRFAVRLKTVGLRGLQGDDYFSFIVTAFYATGSCVTYLIYFLGTNVEGSVLQKKGPLPDDYLHDFIKGSKLEMVAWYSYTGIIWGLKGTMLCFFSRMTIGTWHNTFVKIVSVISIVSYIIVFFTITFSCRPFYKNWQVVPDPGCLLFSTLQNFIATTVLNILCDALILSIPVPLLWKLQVSLKKKIGVGILLSSGAFVIVAAIIRIVITLSASPSALNINSWGVRETLVGIITVNIPALRPLFRRSFWTGGPTTLGSSMRTTAGGGRSQDITGPYELTPSVNESSGYPGKGNSSQESIVGKGDFSRSVIVRTTYGITHDQDDSNHDQTWSGKQGLGTKSAVRSDGNIV